VAEKYSSATGNCTHQAESPDETLDTALDDISDEDDLFVGSASRSGYRSGDVVAIDNDYDDIPFVRPISNAQALFLNTTLGTREQRSTTAIVAQSDTIEPTQATAPIFVVEQTWADLDDDGMPPVTLQTEESILGLLYVTIRCSERY